MTLRNFFLTVVSLLTSLLLLSGCLSSLEGYQNEIDNMQVPRLMIEARGIDYGGGSGGKAILPISGTAIKLEREPVVGEYDIINVLMMIKTGLNFLPWPVIAVAVCLAAKIDVSAHPQMIVCSRDPSWALLLLSQQLCAFLQES